MKNIICLSVEIKREKSKAPQFLFNDTMVQAMLSGLSVVYDEVFMWACGRRMAIWIVGTHTDFLIQSCVHHRNKFKSIQLLVGDDAVQLMDKITNGDAWKDQNVVYKLSTLEEAYTIAEKTESIGIHLNELIRSGIDALKQLPVVSGAKNGWVKASDNSGIVSSEIDREFNSFFYRFSIN